MTESIITTLPRFTPEKITLRPTEEALQQIKVHFYDPAPSDPVYICVPGFRSPGIEAAENVELFQALNGKNLPVLAFDYSGCRNKEASDEPSTFESFVTDMRETLMFVGDRPHVIMAHSYGGNIAAKCMNANTAGFIWYLPAPDLIRNKIIAKIEKNPLRNAFINAAFSLNGYYISESKKSDGHPTAIKLTRLFIESARKDECQIESILAESLYKPPVRIIHNENDELANRLGAKNLEDVFKAHDFKVATHFIPGANKHRLFPQTIDKIVEVASEFSLRELALG